MRVVKWVVCATWLAVVWWCIAGVMARGCGGKEGGGMMHDSPDTTNSTEMESLARFAIDEHNKKENSMLEFVRVVKAREQVVAGLMYYLTMEAKEGKMTNWYDAKLWIKPWMNFKKLEEFKLSDQKGATS
ncbi:hypothetical protein LUZ60_011162 [Juncus effusus]|nr:hypothetical protein LUZ60_011162 [Juncus effusus]